jgi:predicted GNAT family acetyltransferase
MKYEIIKSGEVAASEVEELRTVVGWDNTEGQCQRALEKAYSRYIVRNEGKLIAYLSVVSDGVADAFLVDLMVHPDFRGKGIGTRMVRQAIIDLKGKVQCVHVTFNPENEPFYKHVGFHIFKGGIFDFKNMKIPFGQT